MKQIKVSEATSRVLDYLVALCEGFVWAKNACKRSGDFFCDDCGGECRIHEVEVPDET